MNEADIATVERVFHTLAQHCGERGDNEGAVATLERIIRERDSASVQLKDAVRNIIADESRVGGLLR